jgi:hypothetical protein
LINWAELVDNHGKTIAHQAAEHGYLPPNFDRWELADKEGKTVAQVAYANNHLPEDFPFYGLLNGSENERYIVVDPSIHISINHFNGNKKCKSMSDFNMANIFL